jgi:hypothetical protein
MSYYGIGEQERDEFLRNCENGDTKAITAFLEKTITLSLNISSVLLNRAIFLCAMNDFPGAQDIIEKIIDRVVLMDFDEALFCGNHSEILGYASGDHENKAMASFDRFAEYFKLFPRVRALNAAHLIADLIVKGKVAVVNHIINYAQDNGPIYINCCMDVLNHAVFINNHDILNSLLRCFNSGSFLHHSGEPHINYDRLMAVASSRDRKTLLPTIKHWQEKSKPKYATKLVVNTNTIDLPITIYPSQS